MTAGWLEDAEAQHVECDGMCSWCGELDEWPCGMAVALGKLRAILDLCGPESETQGVGAAQAFSNRVRALIESGEPT